MMSSKPSSSSSYTRNTLKIATVTAATVSPAAMMAAAVFTTRPTVRHMPDGTGRRPADAERCRKICGTSSVEPIALVEPVGGPQVGGDAERRQDAGDDGGHDLNLRLMVNGSDIAATPSFLRRVVDPLPRVTSTPIIFDQFRASVTGATIARDGNPCQVTVS